MDRSAESLLAFCSRRDYPICHDWYVWDKLAQDNYQLPLDLVLDDLPAAVLYQHLAQLYREHPQELIVPLIESDDPERLEQFLRWAPLIQVNRGTIQLDPETNRALAAAVDTGSAEMLDILLHHLSQYAPGPIRWALAWARRRAVLQDRPDLVELIAHYYPISQPTPYGARPFRGFSVG